jgi:hypothetical protein
VFADTTAVMGSRKRKVSEVVVRDLLTSQP